MSEFNLIDYAPIGIMFLVAMGFAVSQILVTQLIGPRKRTAAKLMPYESGKDPIGTARNRFSIKFYTVAVAFLLFDLEVLFIIPFAVAFKYLLSAETAATNTDGILYGTIAFITMMIFLATIVIGLIFEWKKGTFDWSEQARAEARAESRALLKHKKSRFRDLKNPA